MGLSQFDLGQPFPFVEGQANPNFRRAHVSLVASLISFAYSEYLGEPIMGLAEGATRPINKKVSRTNDWFLQ